MTTETPRTDAAEVLRKHGIGSMLYVDPDFCRKLERELNAIIKCRSFRMTDSRKGRRHFWRQIRRMAAMPNDPN